jgi:ABC-type dipeptide/oligopeptide/nickel transport system permease component
MIEELRKDYITAARARGISDLGITWHHALRNTLLPALNSSLVSSASLLTSVFIVEAIFNFPGISQFLNNALKITYLGQELVPDVNAALGISLYSILVVLMLMSILDLVQSSVDPRYRQGISRP